MLATWGQPLLSADDPADINLPRPPGRAGLSAPPAADTQFAHWAVEIRPRLVALARRFLWNTHDAEEVAQEALMLAWRDIGKLKDAGKLNAWAYRTTVNLSLNRRRRLREGEFLDAETLPERHSDAAPAHETAELTHRLRIAIEQLPDRQQAALVLREMEELDYRQVAAVMGMRASTARVLVHRAREALRQILLRQWPDTFGPDR